MGHFEEKLLAYPSAAKYGRISSNTISTLSTVKSKPFSSYWASWTMLSEKRVLHQKGDRILLYQRSPKQR
jgi:hypothetical protein